MTEIEFLEDAGRQIAYRQWPISSPKAVIHIVHGMSEHSGCYADIAPQLNAAGYSVFAHDHCCHGANVPEAELGNLSETQNWDNIHADMLRINTMIRERYPDLPLALLGHSMGSFIAHRFAQQHPQKLDALLLEGSSFEPRWLTAIASRLAALECFRQGENGRSALLYALTFGGFNRRIKNPRTPFDWVTRNTQFVDAYHRDPRCGMQVANGYWRDMFRFLNTLYKTDSLKQLRSDLPVYVFSGDQDPVGHEGKGVLRLVSELTSTAGLKHLTHRLYPGAWHDLLHETNSDEVIGDLQAWLADHLPVRA